MTIEPREYIDNDKRMPVTLAGDSGKLLAVGAAETVYEHVPPGATLTGQIIMWPLNTPPAGFLLCDGSACLPPSVIVECKECYLGSCNGKFSY